MRPVASSGLGLQFPEKPFKIIDMIETLTTFEKLSIIAQGFAKIAYNFWPAIVGTVIVAVIIHRQETSSK